MRYPYRALFLFLFIPFLTNGEILETHHFNEIHSHLVPETLVVLDIDDTLLVPAQMLGCDEWYQCRLRHHQKEGFDRLTSVEKGLAEWEAVRHLSQMEIVEPGTPDEVRKLQDQGYAVMGLTTQGLALATRTKQQLLDNQIDLTKTAPTSENLYLTVDGHGVLFRGGVLYTSGTHKGKALFGLLEKVGATFKRVIFINDKGTHLLPVEKTAKEKGVEFVGLRYSYSDARKKAFQENIAHYQFTHSSFAHILSDEEAKKRLNL